jgi:hypothetical protein
MAFPGPNYFLPGSLDCSASDGATPAIASLALDSADRAWLATSNCELAVPFALATGADWPLLYQGSPRISVPTEITISGAFTTYISGMPGNVVASFDTNLTSAVARVGNRLVVATSNFAAVGSNPELNPGTVLLFEIDDGGPTTTVQPASPAYVVTSDPNPTALSVLPGGLVAITNTGLHDVAFPPLVTGPGSVDILDPAAGVLLGSVPLGPNPGGGRLALDASGSVAVLSSHVERVLFAIDIRGLDLLPDPGIDPTQQRPSCNDAPGPSAGGLPCLRARAVLGAANPLVLPPPPLGSGSSGFVPQVRFGASGDFVAATSFNDGGLALASFDARNLDRPHPLLPSRFGAPETLQATPPPAFGSECCPGPMVLHASSASGVNGAVAVWMTAAPTGVAVRATLSGLLAPATGDYDADGFEDAIDVCPLTSDDQADSGAVATATPDGVGDVCQCGDVDDDGIVTAGDAALIQLELSGQIGSLSAPQKCDVSGDGSCTVVDVVRSLRAVWSLQPALVQQCAPAVP